jgi:hypothetical protein
MQINLQRPSKVCLGSHMFEIGPTRPSNLFTKARNRFLAQFYPTRIVKDPSQFSEVYSKNNNCNKIHDIRYVSNLKDK